MTKTLILIGGGDLRAKETLAIDRAIAAHTRALHPDVDRPTALFIGTASHDSMPYYNTFHKTYTGELGLKTDVALTVYGEMNEEKINAKFQKADLIYIGGGDTLFMLAAWEKSGLLAKIREAYERGVVVSGCSAGAICWGTKMFTDSSDAPEGKYRVENGLGLLPYGVCPHYDLRRDEFRATFDAPASEAFRDPHGVEWLCVENNAAAVFRDGALIGALSSGGKCLLSDGKTETPVPVLPEIL